MKIPARISQIGDNKYRGICPSLPGCVAIGESYDDAEVRLQQVAESYLASLDVLQKVKLETDKMAR